MKTLKNIVIVSVLLALFAIACKETDEFKPFSTDKTPPDAVISTSVEDSAGYSIIRFTIPDDPKILYVQADYERNGQKVEAKASFFQNYIMAEGFAYAEEHEVKLYTVSRAEVKSEAVTVTIRPKPSPIHEVLASLKVVESFGGMKVDFVNKTKANIVIGLVRLEDENTSKPSWANIDNYYTSLVGGKFAVRGLDAVKRRFGFFVRDKWLNHTDTIEMELTPIYEEELDGKNKILDARGRGYKVPQRSPLPLSGGPIVEPGNLSSWPWSKLFDGDYSHGNGFHTTERKDQPVWIPIDLVDTVKLSRYKIYQRLHSNRQTYYYSHGNPRKWQIFGTNTPLDSSSWVLIDDQIMVKPSGLPLGELTEDDRTIAEAGMEYEFPADTPRFRYIAWKHIHGWASIDGATGFLHMSELKVWGQIQNNK